MREIRQHGSEGGGAGRPALPTPMGTVGVDETGNDARAVSQCRGPPGAPTGTLGSDETMSDVRAVSA